MLDLDNPPPFSPMSQQAAAQIATWSYPPPYTLYNHTADNQPRVIEEMLMGSNAFYVLAAMPAEPLAFCGFGANARVTGGDYVEPCLDIGMGVHPEWTGKGWGITVGELVLRFAEVTYGPGPRRVTIAEFNQRAIRVWTRLGLCQTDRFERSRDGRAFVVLLG